MDLISNDYYIKIFNKEHIILEEVYEISELTYTKTLNGIWKASLTLPRSIKTTEDILQNNNHIEIYRRINEMNVYKQHISAREELLWWGVIYNSNPHASFFTIDCFGYGRLIQDKLFTMYIRQDNNVFTGEYDKVLYNMLNVINNMYNTGVSQGTAHKNNLQTTRIINWNDNFYDKLDEFTTDANYFWQIDKNRKLNLYTSLGIDKTYYEINSDINVNKTLSITSSGEIYNYIVAKNTYTDDSDIEHSIIAEAKDLNSIYKYGVFSKELVVNDIRLQSTLDKYVEDELNKCKNPLISISLNVSNCDTFNIFDVEVGDNISLILKEISLNTEIKIIEFTIDCKTETMNIELGNCMFREESPKVYRF